MLCIQATFMDNGQNNKIEGVPTPRVHRTTARRHKEMMTDEEVIELYLGNLATEVFAEPPIKIEGEPQVEMLAPDEPRDMNTPIGQGFSHGNVDHIVWVDGEDCARLEEIMGKLRARLGVPA